jgi:hypothetical protein
VTKGKLWSVEEVRMLCDLVNAGFGLDEICLALSKTRDSVKSKMGDLGLHLVKVVSGVDGGAGGVSLPLELADDLPSIEAKLRVVDAASRALEQPGLATSEVLRLRALMNGALEYTKAFALFAGYKKLEVEVAALRRELEEKKKRDASKA